jgi:hypothetical protein
MLNVKMIYRYLLRTHTTAPNLSQNVSDSVQNHIIETMSNQDEASESGGVDSLIQQYYQEYCELLKQIRLDSSQSQHRRLVSEARSLLRQMTVEAHDSDKSDEWLQRIQIYSDQLQIIQRDAERATLLGSRVRTGDSNNDMLTRQLDTLEQAKRTLAETEEIAGGIVDNLQDNRTAIESSRQKISSLLGLTQQANTISDNLNRPWWKKI